MARRKGPHFKDSKSCQRPLTSYEEERRRTIEKNAKVFEKIGLSTLAKQLREKGHKKQGIQKPKKADDDQDYNPSEASESDDENTDLIKTHENTEHISVSMDFSTMANKVHNQQQSAVTVVQKKKQQSKCPAMSMSDFLKQRQEHRQHPATRHLQPPETSQIVKENTEHIPEFMDISAREDNKGYNQKQNAVMVVQKRKQQLKCPTISMGDFLSQRQEFQQEYQQQSTTLQMQEVSNNDGGNTEHILEEVSVTAQQVETRKQSETMVQNMQQPPKCVEMSMTAHQLATEQPQEEMHAQMEQRRRSKRQAIAQQAAIRALDNHPSVEHSNMPENEDELVKKHRGPTMLFDVHARKFEDRVVVLFNDKSQPIGPTDKIVNEFSKFLGTIAHDDNWAPLIYTNWSKVPDKEEMWKYVNEKYVIPVSAKKWVLQCIRDSWRVFKSRIKRDHFYKYDNDADRWKYRPSRVPEPHFKVLLEYWKDDTVKKISAKNSENREKQDNMHTMGPISFARKYHKLMIDESQAPSKIRMFEETRKRKEGRTYKRPNNDTLDKIKRMKEIEALQEAGLDDNSEDPFDQVMEKREHSGRLRLYGRGVCSTDLKGKGVENPQLLAPELVNALKADLGEDMQKNLDAHKQKMDVELQAEKEKVTTMQKELDAQKTELEAQKVELDAQKLELDAQKAKVNHALLQIQKLIPDITPEKIAQLVLLSPGSTLENLMKCPTVNSTK